MQLTAFAQWLNNTFFSFDYAILASLHSLAVSAGEFFTPFFKMFSFLGDNALLIFAVAIVMLFFKKTRRTGICMIVSVLLSAVLCNGIIKELVLRPRPYLCSAVPEFHRWWTYTGSVIETQTSFPSGHTTVNMAGVTARVFTYPFRKKYIWISYIYVLLVGISRNYLCVHYPTDVIGGMITGALAALAGIYLVSLLYYLMNKHRNVRFFAAVLDSDIKKTKK